MAGPRLRTGTALLNTNFRFPGSSETLSGAGGLGLFPEVGAREYFLFQKITPVPMGSGAA